MLNTIYIIGAQYISTPSVTPVTKTDARSHRLSRIKVAFLKVAKSVVDKHSKQTTNLKRAAAPALHLHTAACWVLTALSSHHIPSGQSQWPHWLKASHYINRPASLQSNHPVDCAKSSPLQRHLSHRHACAARASYSVGFVLCKSPRHALYQCSALVPVQIISSDLVDAYRSHTVASGLSGMSKMAAFPLKLTSS